MNHFDQRGKIVWNDKLSVGNVDIDHEHLKLLELYNDLAECAESGEHKKRLSTILSGLTDYCLTHFHKEEQRMQLVAYPYLSQHILKHKDFIFKVAMYNVDLLNDNPPQAIEILHFLKNWWINHILRSDRDYESYFKEILSVQRDR